MHSYVIEKNKQNSRRKVYIGFFIISFILTKLIHLILANIDILNLPSWVSFWFPTPGFFLILGIVYYIFNRYLWKFSFINKMLTVPNLSGEWVGFIKTSHNGNNMNKYIDIKMEIDQTWNQMKIKAQTKSSTSESKVGWIITDNSDIQLKFEYLNEPHYDSDESLNTHIGYNVFEIKNIKNKRILNGKYFSGRSRKNYGVIKLVKNEPDMDTNEIKEFLETNWKSI